MLKNKKILFARICGTGVSSVALICQDLGANVIGTDLNYYPPVSDSLKRAGIACYPLTDLAGLIENEKPDIIVVGNALAGKSAEAEMILKSGIPYYSMPSFMEEFLFENHRNIVAAGTHGKTTTTTILSEVLCAMGEKVSYMIGGIPNFSMKNAQFEESGYFVIEGDEYDTAFFDKGPKFLHYKPDISIITSIEFDHADIYNNVEEIFENFKKLIKITSKKTILCIDFENNRKMLALFPRELFFTYSTKDKKADLFLEKTTVKERFTGFKYYVNGRESREFFTPYFGDQNLMNFAALMSVLELEKMAQNPKLFDAIKGLKGVKRRQEYLGKINNTPTYSDFAHHPTAVKLTLDGFRELFPEAKFNIVFDPATNSNSRNIFEKDYLECLSVADNILISKPAKLDRTPPEERFSPQRVAEAINAKKEHESAFFIPETDDVLKWLLEKSSLNNSVNIIMSNSGFGGLFDKLKQYLS